MKGEQVEGVTPNVTFSLMKKLVALTLAVTACSVVISAIVVEANVRRTTFAAFEDRLSYETTMLGQMTAAALFGELDPTDTSLNEPVRTLADSVRTQLSVLAKDGTIVADSDGADALGRHESQAAAPEIVMARATGKGMAIRQNRMFVAQAIVRDGKTLGFARSSIALREITESVQSVLRRLALGSVVALLFALTVGVIFSSRIVGPIRALSAGARKVGGGDFGYRIEIDTRDEIGELAASFNAMTKSLRETVTTVSALDARNRDMRIVLDNIDQGLLTVERSGRMSVERSAALARWFGPTEANEAFVDYLGRLDSRAATDFGMQFEQLLQGILPLRLLLEQLPKRLVRDREVFELSYIPILECEIVARLLVVITDVTAREAARRAESEQREMANIFERIMRNKATVREFFDDAAARVQALTATENRPPPAEIQRSIHTLKGNSAAFGLQVLAALCHAIEERSRGPAGDLSEEDRGALTQEWTRVAERIGALLGDQSHEQVVLDRREYAAFLGAMANGAPRAELLRQAREWKFERLGDRLAYFAYHARELSARLGKCAVTFEVRADNVRLPREAWGAFWASFIHVVRNAVDHGLETEAERIRARKALPARIRLGAARRGDDLVVELADDGRGIDWEALAASARAAGLRADRREDVVAAMFALGVSSKAKASDVSGRGTGLAAVREACERLGGHVTVESDFGCGTSFRFVIPLKSVLASVPPAAGHGVDAAWATPTLDAASR